MIFVVEDDTQNGADHVDGHRSIFLAISPWVKKEYVSKTHISLASIFKTVNLILGLPPLNQYDAAATDLRDMFTEQDPTSAPIRLPADPVREAGEPALARAHQGRRLQPAGRGRSQAARGDHEVRRAAAPAPGSEQVIGGDEKRLSRPCFEHDGRVIWKNNWGSSSTRRVKSMSASIASPEAEPDLPRADAQRRLRTCRRLHPNRCRVAFHDRREWPGTRRHPCSGGLLACQQQDRDDRGASTVTRTPPSASARISASGSTA